LLVGRDGRNGLLSDYLVVWGPGKGCFVREGKKMYCDEKECLVWSMEQILVRQRESCCVGKLLPEVR
jgi:hypothetical protein